MSYLKNKHVFITGASSGIGLETAKLLANAKVKSLVLGARRKSQLESIAKQLRKNSHAKIIPLYLDVRDKASCETFVEEAISKTDSADILINNAGLAAGLDPVVSYSESDAEQMIDTNVLGLLRMTKLVLPYMIKKMNGHIVNIGSIAGYVPYEGASIYCGTKYAVRAITESLRLEVLDKNIRVSNISPGMTETEFSLIRFKGDKQKAKSVYENVTPLTGKDIAQIIYFTLSLPEHVNIDELIVRPLQQGTRKVHRTKSP